MLSAWFGLFVAAALGVMLVLDISGVRPQPFWRLSTLPPARQRRHLLLQRLLLACAALYALILSLQHVLPSRSGYMVAENVIAVGLTVGIGLIMIYLFGRDRRAVSEETMVQVIRRARARDNKRALVGALRAQARVMIKQRRWEEAERALAEGLAVAQAMPDPQAEARLLEMGACYAPSKVRWTGHASGWQPHWTSSAGGERTKTPGVWSVRWPTLHGQRRQRHNRPADRRHKAGLPDTLSTPCRAGGGPTTVASSWPGLGLLRRAMMTARQDKGLIGT